VRFRATGPDTIFSGDGHGGLKQKFYVLETFAQIFIEQKYRIMDQKFDVSQVFSVSIHKKL